MIARPYDARELVVGFDERPVALRGVSDRGARCVLAGLPARITSTSGRALPVSTASSSQELAGT